MTGLGESSHPGELLGSAITWRTSDVSTSTLGALLTSGDLNLLLNPVLRADLAANYVVAGEVSPVANLPDQDLLALPNSAFAEWVVQELDWAGFDPVMGSARQS